MHVYKNARFVLDLILLVLLKSCASCFHPSNYPQPSFLLIYTCISFSRPTPQSHFTYYCVVFLLCVVYVYIAVCLLPVCYLLWEP